MTKPSIDDLLRRSIPDRMHPRTSRSVADLVDETRKASARRRRPRAAVLIPILGLGGLALTGGTMMYMTSVRPDVAPIPIVYTTDTGTVVSCEVYLASFSLEEPDAKPMEEFLSKQDWTGVGQRIYDRALELSAIPIPDWGSATDAEHDTWAWVEAQHEYTTDTIPPELFSNTSHMVTDSSCTGQLH